MDAEKTGRIQIVCFDICGETLTCANIYGWKGSRPGTAEAERTDDLICICRLEFERMPPGPTLIAGDFNGPLEAFPTIMSMFKEEGWMDVGANSEKCGATPTSQHAKSTQVRAKPG